MQSLAVAALTACALRPLPAQTATVSSTNPYLRMCDGVARPVVTDSSKNYRPAATSTGTLCWLLRTAIAPPPVDTTTKTPPPPPPPPGAWFLIRDRTPTLTAPGWYVSDNVSSVTVQNDPTGQPALAMRFPAGYAGGSSPAGVGTEGFSYARLRFEATIAYPLNYVKHQSSVDKSVYVQVNGQNLFFTMMYDRTRLLPAVGVQGIVSHGVSANFTANLALVEIQRGTRRTLACELVGNTAYVRDTVYKVDTTTVRRTLTTGRPDGTIECWLDDVKFLSRSAIQFTPGAARFTGIAWVPIWGGADGALAAEQYAYLARLRVYGQ